MPATGTSVSTHATRIVTISTSDARISIIPIVVPMLGTELADTATIIAIAATSVPPAESISACTTVGTVVTSVAATVTVLLASQLVTEAVSDEAPSKEEILAGMEESNAETILSSVGTTPSSAGTILLEQATEGV